MSEQEPRDVDRRGLLRCMGWAGTGLVWTMAGGVPAALGLNVAAAKTASATGFSFVQVSDSHIGFRKAANPDATVTYREAIAGIKALPEKPAFIVHTGDITQLSKAEEFDAAEQIISEAGLPVFHVPGEHDMLDEGAGAAYLSRFGKGTKGAGWHAFDHQGVHFVALVNVANLKPGGMGSLGEDQIAWLANDLEKRSASQPIVVLAHMPLWTITADWGWGTEDSAQAMALLNRFGSVTVLNGHIHQIMQKTEGHIAFHTARSTAFPQPAPGTAAGPGPLSVPAEKLRAMLGLTSVSLSGAGSSTLTDRTLAG